MIPLVIRLVNISDTLALSVETRGITKEEADACSVYKTVTLCASDIMFFAGCFDRLCVGGGAMKAIELKNVSLPMRGYEEKVLNDASLSVDYGEVALLSGFSGEGKHGLSLIAGIIPNITPGEITVKY